MLEKGSSFRRNTCLAAGLGVLSGLTFVLRLNDGAALIGAVAVIILCVAPGRKLALVAVFSLAVALTIGIIVLISGDTFRSTMPSIRSSSAAGAKGGVASLLAYPFLAPGNAVRVSHRGAVDRRRGLRDPGGGFQLGVPIASFFKEEPAFHRPRAALGVACHRHCFPATSPYADRWRSDSGAIAGLGARGVWSQPGRGDSVLPQPVHTRPVGLPGIPAKFSCWCLWRWWPQYR